MGGFLRPNSEALKASSSSGAGVGVGGLEGGAGDGVDRRLAWTPVGVGDRMSESERAERRERQRELANRLKASARRPRPCKQILAATTPPPQPARCCETSATQLPGCSTSSVIQSLYCSTRGALKHELTRCLRTGRAVRRPSRKVGRRCQILV